MKTLVLGATGTVGREVVRALLARRAPVRALVRSPSTARDAIPSAVELVPGDIRDRDSLARALHGVSAVFYASPHEADEEALAENVLAAAHAADVRLVFVGVHLDGNRLTRALMRFVFGMKLPHYRPKLRLAERVRTSPVRSTILLASNFFRNDELFREAILRGEYLAPLAGMNRVDVRDIGEGAARVLLDDSLARDAIPLVGPASLSGAQSAAIWSQISGREVRYLGDDFGRFEREVRRVVRGRKVEDLIASYRALGRLELPTDPAQVAATTALLGRPPHDYASYVRDALARWDAEARASDAGLPAETG